MNLEAIRHSFERDGFVHGGAIIDRPQAKALAAELDEYVAARFHGAESSRPQPAVANDLARTEGDNLYQLCNLFEVSDGFICHPI